MEAKAESSSVKSATRTLDILEYVVSSGRPVSAAEIALSLAIPVSSLSYLLGTLVERGYLLRSGRLHSPGPALARLNPAPEAIPLKDRVYPVLRSVSRQLNETVSFFVRHGENMEAIAGEVAPQALRYTIEVGRLVPLHAFAAGKAILAALDPQELDAYFAAASRAAFTPQTRTAEAELRRELAQIAQAGIARTAEEFTPGIIGIGHAVHVGGSLVGAISAAIPVARATPDLEQRAAVLLTQAAQALGGE
ncbi:IclR family acetate operon transcriptional repressor [Sphingobium sp. B2D3A]|uniref:IclR family transcriptional regulator n=1 Tax=unclassified Sphingobium TaxID=2611147 RepID=UPI002225A13D|nr:MULTISPECIES: IclR family transcriptional regulator [unclassified Sphingobium]MCW2337956.1 IclR family acetate operon transcriptional repressor [Sphingobium sp. B2D3A]MCW2384415.1 IclR family acetate operon transcriptional repressor [Sphingobium sp. B2D3D]